MSIVMQIAIVAPAILLIDWALLWQVENAFSAFLKKDLIIPKMDRIRFAILFAIFLTVVALLVRLWPDIAGVAGIILVILYFWRIVWTAKPSRAAETS